MKTKALFFSRGRGHGHAIPDMAIADAMAAQGSNVDFSFASYSTGAATFQAAGRSVHNLGFPENNPFLPTLFKAKELIESEKPDVVLAHEEFAALPAARLCGVPSIFISAWFPPDGSLRAEALAYASSLVMIERAGLFPQPASLTAKPIFVGPLLRKLKFGLGDRDRLRAEAKIEPDAAVVVVVTGGSATEKTTPVLETVLSAYLALGKPLKRLFWISAKDAALVKARAGSIRGVEALPFVDPIERFLAIADVVVTKGTHVITLDCASIGVPSISLSPNTNPVDDILVPRVRSNVALNARAVDAEALHGHLEEILARGSAGRAPSVLGDVGCELTAKTLDAEIKRVTEHAR